MRLPFEICRLSTHFKGFKCRFTSCAKNTTANKFESRIVTKLRTISVCIVDLFISRDMSLSLILCGVALVCNVMSEVHSPMSSTAKDNNFIKQRTDQAVLGITKAQEENNRKKETPIGSYITDVDLSSLSSGGVGDGGAAGGFVITCATVGDSCGSALSGAGDVNGDGVEDVIIGAKSSNNNAGTTYVFFGSKSKLPDINLRSFASGATGGFKILGANDGDFSGAAVSSAGDVNQDGFADIIVGAYGASPNSKSAAGITYVVFGQQYSDTFEDMNLGSFKSGPSGFKILGKVK